MDLFVHRGDVFAVQQESGAYFPERRPITADDIEDHLAGNWSLGVYVIDPLQDDTVRYIVWDLDIVDEDAANKLCELVEHMQLANGESKVPAGYERCLLREFSGNKGTHVWMFFDEPVPAEKVRRWVAADFMPQWAEAANANGWPAAIEVFPKQDSVPAGGFGNLIKLPLGKHAVSGNFSTVVGCQGWANSVGEVQPLPAALIPDREVVNPVRGLRRERVERGGATDGPASPFPCVDEIMRNGVGRGNRDNAMFHLALYCYGHGLDEDIALDVCERANENFDPPMSQSEVEHKVSSAYRGVYESATCGQGWLGDICPGPCRSGWHVKRDATSGALDGAEVGSTVEVEVINILNDKTARRVTIGHPDADNTPTLVCRRKA